MGGLSMRQIITALLLFTCLTGVHAQDKMIAELQALDARVFKPDSVEAKQRWESIKKLRDEVNKRDVETWRTIKTKADWEKLRDERIARLRDSLGFAKEGEAIYPEPAKPVKVVTTKKIAPDGCTIECLLYESRPNFYVTANLYVPADTSKPMPGFIIVHSHHNPKTQGELQDMGMLWARQGCLVLIPDMLGHGERRQHPFVNEKSYPEAFKVGRQDYHFRYNVNLQLSLVGESLMGWMVRDLIRGLDVLYQRPNLDKTKIMVFGSVAGGGDPCAVFAAIDRRVTAAAPFNFGGPQPETKFPLPDDAELAFNYMGGGSWESTRNLKLSARYGFLPWVIVGSLAPRGLIYSHEFAWDEKRDPVWARYQKIWGEFYNASDKLASAKGSGSVTGKAPESTHCNNIGAIHRKPMYPTLQKWFGLPIPEENKKRFDSSELQCWTEEARKSLKSRMVHEMIRDSVRPVHLPAKFLGTLEDLLGIIRKPGAPAATFAPVGQIHKGENLQMQRLAIVREGLPTIPLVILTPRDDTMVQGIVIGLAQEGKAGFLKHRAEVIAELLKNNIAVCLPDLRGTGETANDGRGRTSGATSYSASLLMHGQTVPGAQFHELEFVINTLAKLGYKRMALWGDSFAAPNDPDTNFAVPHDAAKMPRQSEPMGTLLALMGGIYRGDVKAIYARGGLVSFASMLESPFCYFPHDAVIPGVLQNIEMETLVMGNPRCAVRLEGLVDGLNRRVEEKKLKAAYKNAMFDRPAHNLLILREQPAAASDVAAWLAAQIKK